MRYRALEITPIIIIIIIEQVTESRFPGHVVDRKRRQETSTLKKKKKGKKKVHTFFLACNTSPASRADKKFVITLINPFRGELLSWCWLNALKRT